MTQSQERSVVPSGHTLGPLLEAVRTSCPPVAREPYPPAMFTFLNDYRPAVVLELVVLREMPGVGLCVLIKDRLPSDIGYEGECHVPGGFLLNEETIGEALQRIAFKEVGVENAVGNARLAGVMNNPITQRGHEVHLVFLVELWPPDFTLGEHSQWVPLKELPDNLMASHWLITDMANTIRIGDRAPGFFTEYSEM